jgi:hypothetical protein
VVNFHVLLKVDTRSKTLTYKNGNGKIILTRKIPCSKNRRGGQKGL